MVIIMIKRGFPDDLFDFVVGRLDSGIGHLQSNRIEDVLFMPADLVTELLEFIDAAVGGFPEKLFKCYYGRQRLFSTHTCARCL